MRTGRQEHDVSLASSQRMLRIQTLAAKLAELSVLNTAGVRERCRDIALEIVGLLTEEDAYRRSLPVSELDSHEAALERLAEALRGCREAGEQCELTRLHVISEQLHRARDDERDGAGGHRGQDIAREPQAT